MLDEMVIEYEDQKWKICPTTKDCNSFFHAAFGELKEDGYYTDKFATSRRMNWSNFLSFYETRSRPTHLKGQLEDYFKEKGWTIEDDGDFLRYMRDIGNERQIRLEELMALASLENVKIVLFKNEGAPKIIEPQAEILVDYPLVNKNPFQTVVVAFKEPSYSKLRPVSEGKTDSVSFKKFPSVGVAGIFYEINLLTLVLLNGLEKHEAWRLSTNAVNASNFDDVIFEFGSTNSAILLQAKWRRKKVYVSDLLGNKYSGFTLSKYFFAYHKARCHYNINSVILCTNARIKLDWVADFVNTRSLVEDDLLHFEGVTSNCYTFKDDFIPILIRNLTSYDAEHGQKHLITEENAKIFLRDFHLITCYPKDKTLEQAIESKILGMGLSEKYNSTDYTRYLNKKVTEWYDGKGQYLTPLQTKVIFCAYKNDKLLEKLHNLEIVFKRDKARFDFAKRVVHVVPKSDHILTLLKVTKFLANDRDRTVFLSTNESVYTQELMADAFESTNYANLVVYSTVQTQEVQGLHDRIVRVLNKFSHKKVVLITEQRDRLAKMLRGYYENSFQTIEDCVTFTDVTEDSQEKLLEKAVLFYEASL